MSERIYRQNHNLNVIKRCPGLCSDRTVRDTQKATVWRETRTEVIKPATSNWNFPMWCAYNTTLNVSKQCRIDITCASIYSSLTWNNLTSSLTNYGKFNSTHLQLLSRTNFHPVNFLSKTKRGECANLRGGISKLCIAIDVQLLPRWVFTEIEGNC
jgi:hypothetical protein